MANLGLYHPTHNPFGCKLASDSKPWYETTVVFNSTKDCFTPSKLLENSGTIASGKSGRPSAFPDTYYDAVYAHQIKDLRLSAHKQDVNKLRVDAMRKAVAGEMRGWGKVPFTKVSFQRFTTASPSTNGIELELGFNTKNDVSAGDYITYVDEGNNIVVPRSLIVSIGTVEGSHDYVIYNGSPHARVNGYAIFEKLATPQTDTLAWTSIAGSPENIALTFNGGISGQWFEG